MADTIPGLPTSSVFEEARWCRRPCCANVPERPEGRRWRALVFRFDDSGKIQTPQVIAREQTAFDGAEYLPQFHVTFTPTEWEGMDRG